MQVGWRWPIAIFLVVGLGLAARMVRVPGDLGVLARVGLWFAIVGLLSFRTLLSRSIDRSSR